MPHDDFESNQVEDAENRYQYEEEQDPISTKSVIREILLLLLSSPDTRNSLKELTTELKEDVNKQTNSVALVRKRTIPTERPPLVGEVSINFCGQRVSRGQRNGSPRPYAGRIYKLLNSGTEM
jgi:hypothetical protein